MPSIHRQDIKDTMLLCEIAKKTIVDVMRRNADEGEPGRWRELSVGELVSHARDHLSTAYLCLTTKKNAENALVRLAMALIKLEEENTD